MTVVASCAILDLAKWLDAELRKLGGFAVFICLDCVPSKCTACVSDPNHDCQERPDDLPLSGFTDNFGALHRASWLR